jgi:hypothetical protein
MLERMVNRVLVCVYADTLARYFNLSDSPWSGASHMHNTFMPEDEKQNLTIVTAMPLSIIAPRKTSSHYPNPMSTLTLSMNRQLGAETAADNDQSRK